MSSSTTKGLIDQTVKANVVIIQQMLTDIAKQANTVQTQLADEEHSPDIWCRRLSSDH